MRSAGSWISRLGWLLWLAVLVCVPITSFPLLSQGSGGETPVGPLSLIPLVGLALVWIVPSLLKGARLPGAAKPLLAFAAVAVLSAGASAFLPLLPYKGQTPPARELRALVTLAIGLTFYVGATLVPDTEDRRRVSVRALYLGAAFALAWASVQGWVSLTKADHVPLVMTQVHHLFSVRDLIVDRVSGFAYEPSWLGNQLMVLYLPLLAAGALTRQSVFAIRRGWLSVEAGMLLWGLVILILTKSRLSQLGLLAIASIALITFGGKVLRSFEGRLGWRPSSGGSLRRLGLAAVNTLLLLAIVVGLLIGASAAAARSDSRLWALESIRDQAREIRYLYPNESVFALGDRLAFTERIVYWTSAFRVFSLYPILGVGPGNAGFLLEETLPDYGLRLTEIRNVLNEPSYGFPNPKNLWAKLLAETGIVGFALFTWWFVSMGLGAAVLWKKGAGFERYLGLAGVLAFLAQVVEGFSLDTFALPQLWLVFGLATSALWGSGLLRADPRPPREIHRLATARPGVGTAPSPASQL